MDNTRRADRPALPKDFPYLIWHCSSCHFYALTKMKNGEFKFEVQQLADPSSNI